VFPIAINALTRNRRAGRFSGWRAITVSAWGQAFLSVVVANLHLGKQELGWTKLSFSWAAAKSSALAEAKSPNNNWAFRSLDARPETSHLVWKCLADL
jgi:hypothetical protein